jgi:hypothetical protein
MSMMSSVGLSCKNFAFVLIAVKQLVYIIDNFGKAETNSKREHNFIYEKTIVLLDKTRLPYV